MNSLFIIPPEYKILNSGILNTLRKKYVLNELI